MTRRFSTGRIPADAQPIIKQMTNWQRNQWAKSGYSEDRVQITKFANMKRKK